jgi:tetratricopeptide (TPR) repeat protein
MSNRLFNWNLLFACIIFLNLGILAALNDSIVCDEPLHVLSGHLYLTTGIFSGGVFNPPFMQVMLALPTIGREFYLFQDDAYFYPRIISLLFGILIILISAFWSKQLFGDKAGIFVSWIIALDPNILAHAHLATIDIGSTALILLSLYLTYQLILNFNIKNVLLTAFVFALARLSKITALIVAPLTIIALFIFVIKHKFKGLLYVLTFFEIMIITINAGYLFKGVFSTYDDYKANPDIVINSTVAEAISLVDRVLPDQFIESTIGKFTHTSRGHFAYLHGKYSNEGWDYYYLITILIKTTLSGLILILIALLTGWKITKSKHEGLILISALYFIIVSSLSSSVNIGIRHILLFFPLIYIAGSKIAEWGKRGQVIAGLLILGQAAATISIHPHYLSYFNPLVGGPANGHNWLIDSNIDWGQDDKEFYAFASDHPNLKINPNDTPQTGLIAINVNTLMGIFREKDDLPYPWLRQFKPVKYCGWSWQIYDLTIADFENVVKTDTTNIRARLDLAYAYMSENNFNNADSTLKLIPSSLDVSVAKAKMYEQTNELQFAIDTYSEVVNQSKQYLYLNKDLKLLTTKQQYLTGDCDGILAYLETLIYYNLDSLANAALNDIDSLIDCPQLELEKTLLEMRSGKWEASLNTIISYINTTGDRTDEAMMLLSTAQTYFDASIKGDANAHYELAYFLWERQSYTPAMLESLNCLKQNPGSQDALSLLTEMIVRAKLHLINLDWSQLAWVSTNPNIKH